MEATDNGLMWRKARASAAQNSCVEVGTSPASPAVGIRDTTARHRGMLTVDRAAFAALLDAVRRGELDI
jgi:hypothetical protein